MNAEIRLEVREHVARELREHVARELHDSVAGELQTMLVEMEVLWRRGDVPPEIEECRSAVRGALAHIRRLLRELPADQALVQAAIDRKLAGVLGQRDV